MPEMPDPAAFLCQQLPLVDEVARSVARGHYSRWDEVEEFVARARLKMVEDDYFVLRDFEGRSGLRTYLTVVFTYLFSDERARRWGKWRHSAKARRLGLVAQRVEILLWRERRSPEEAWETLTRNEGCTLTRAEFDALADALPVRPGRHVVEESVLESMSVPGRPAEQGVRARELRTLRCRTHQALARVLAGLGVEDRLILKLHFQDGLNKGAVARALALPEKPFYRRFERLLARLRAELEQDGLEADDMEDFIGEDASVPGADVREDTDALDWTV